MSRRVLLLAAAGVLSVGGLGLARLGAQTDAASEPAPAAQTVTPEGTTLLEAEPLPPPTFASPAANALPDPSPAAPPEPTPPLRTTDVAFPTPAARNESEPLVAIGRPVGRTDYGAQGNRKAARLRSMPPEQFTFDRALLRDVLRFLAERADIPFVSIPENSPQAQQLVTFRMTASAFAALESVARQNGISVDYDEGVWLFNSTSARFLRMQQVSQKEDENELIGVMYQLRHDSADRVDFRTDLLGSQQTVQSQAIAGGVTTPNLPLQNSQKVFAHRVPRIVNDVRAIIGLPPLAIDADGNLLDGSSSGGAILDADRLSNPQDAGVGQRQP